MEAEVEQPVPVDHMPGAFGDSLRRNNKKIREDRAIAIIEGAEMTYKRTVEDLEVEMKQVIRERESMLDLSPTDANSLMLASDFDVKAFVAKDLDLGVKIRNLGIKLDVARSRYLYLFTKNRE